MDHDLLMMIYGAIIGIASSILTSLFQAWMAHREYERRQTEEKERLLRRIALPDEAEILSLSIGEKERASRHSATGTILIFVIPFAFLIYRAHDPLLGLILSAVLAFSTFHLILRTRRI